MKVIGNLTKDAIIRAAVSEGSTVSSAVDSTALFLDADVNNSAVVFDSSNNKFVVAFKRGSDSKGCAVVGTVSGTSISYGSVVEFEQGNSQYVSATFDSSNNKVVICFRDYDDSQHGKAVVGTVSGTSISFGTAVTFNSAATEEIFPTFDSNSNKVVIGYRNDGDSKHGYAIVGTVSGTSISFGSATEFENARVSGEGATFDSNSNKVVFTYRDHGNSNYGTAIIGTVSGTSISFGTAVVYHSSSSQYNSPAFDTSSNKVLIAFRDGGDSDKGKAIVGTVSGTSISFGSVVQFEANTAAYLGNVFDSNANKFVIGYADGGDSNYATIIEATVSGTSVSFGSSTRANASVLSVDSASLAFDSNAKKVLMTYRDDTNTKGRSILYQTGYTSATGGTIADGKAVIVNANGTVSTVSQTTTSESLGSEVQFNGQNSVYTSACFDSAAGKCVVFYRDSGASNAGKYIVGTISGQSITYGSEDFFASASRTQYNSAVFEPVAGKVVIAYQDQDGSFYGKVRVGTLSGTSITWGTPVTFNSNETTYIEAVYHTGEGKIVVAYKNSSGYGRAIAGTVSENSISFGTGVDVDTSGGDYMTAVYHAAAQKVVTAFKATGSIACCRVLTLSGTTITVGARQSFITTGQANQGAIAYDTTSETVVIAFRDEANTTYGSIVAGSVSGDTITYGSFLTFQSGSIDWLGIRGFASGGGVILAYDNNSVSPSTVPVKYFTISGTTITLVSTVTFHSGGISGARSYGFAEDTSNEKMLLAINVDAIGRSKVYNPTFSTTNLTTENFVGIMKGAALDGTNGEILSSCSIARNQTSLTPGQTYFVTPTDGALSETAGSPSVTAGTAISNTELIVKG